MNLRRTSRALAPAAAVLAMGLITAGCSSDNSSTGGGDLTGSVRIDGSSTVAPFTAAAAEFFGEEQPSVQVSVGTSGTGGGFEKFCVGETDANDASRPVKDGEAATCAENGIEFEQLTVAVDALTVVVNSDNDWAECLTVEELNVMWGPDSTATSWADIRSGFPNEPLALFGPGTDSGTFDYFTDVINGEEGASRTDFQPSEDDNVIVKGVQGSRGGLGYFGYTYFEENADTLKAVQIDSGAGCVTPSAETAQDGSYTPLARPLFIYPSTNAVGENPAVKAFFDFVVANDGEIAEAAGYIPLNDSQKAELESTWASISGS